MLKNHLKIAFRNLLKQKGLAFINIFGLSVGFACFCLFLAVSASFHLFLPVSACFLPVSASLNLRKKL